MHSVTWYETTSFFNTTQAAHTFTTINSITKIEEFIKYSCEVILLPILYRL